MPVPASLRCLLSRSIDYAGMFPPCSLALEPALENQAQYVRSPDAWMLSSFVLSVSQLKAAGKDLSRFDPQHPLRISALGPKTSNADDFVRDLKNTVETIRSFAAQHSGIVSIAQLEMPLPAEFDDVLLLTDARAILGDLAVFWEAPANAAERIVALLTEYRGGKSIFGYKLRTGGVTADAFPAAGPIARALMASAKHQVPIKFTAGLHHPLRQFRGEVKTKMHGFLNVLGAAVLAAEHHWAEQQIVAMLEDEDAGSFVFDDDSFAWREWKIGNQQIEARRKVVMSFGSCSFNEPREDLRALNLL
jgi:hypothetical protein